LIISRILGGLGNQMFQYAAGRALSLRLNEAMFVDLGEFADYPLHQGFELSGVFQCHAQIATENEVRNVLGWRSSQYMRRLLLKPQLIWLRGTTFVAEPHFHYWPAFNAINSSCYLSGYWQSEKYFKTVADTIRQDFSFRHSLQPRNLALSQQMAACTAVSLHVRRGDYVSDAKTHSNHGLCSLDYYSDAVAYIAGRLTAPCFFIFSDDIDWCREHLNLDFPVIYIDHNKGADSHLDMQLMSLCDHHIIANSSFSWWGAWLNASAEKIVIAPKRWFAAGHRTDDLIPPEWIRL